MVRGGAKAWWAWLGLWLAGALVVSLVLSFLCSLVLFGLPHGAETAMSWEDNVLRWSWVARFLIPAALVACAVVYFSWRASAGGRDPYGPPPPMDGGRDPYGPRPPTRGGPHR